MEKSFGDVEADDGAGCGQLRPGAAGARRFARPRVCSPLAIVYSVDWAVVWPRAKARPTTLRSVSPVVWSLGVTSMLTDISSEMVSSVLPIYLVVHLSLSPVTVGIVDGFYQGGAVLLRVAAGFTGDRWRRHKAVAVTGYAISAVCKLALLAVGGAWMAIASVIAIDRAGKGIRTAPRDALITFNSAESGRATAFGVHRALDAFGAMLGPTLAFGLLAVLPARFDVVLLASFGVAVVGLAVIVLFVPPPAQAEALRLGPPLTVRAALNVFQDVRFRALCLAAAMLSIAAVSDALLFLVLHERAAITTPLFPILFVGVAVVHFAAAVPVGRLADVVGRLPVLLAGYALLAGLYGGLLSTGAGPGTVVLCVILLGLYYAATDGVLAAAAGRLLPAQACSTGLALVATATSGGRLMASAGFGALWTFHGVDAALGWFAAAIAAALVIATVLLHRTGAIRDDAARPA